jgi:glycerate dehydrogenase
MELNELLATSDIVSIHCPLSDRTRNLIGREEFSLMKPTSIIINVARGGIIDETALAEALDNGEIRGAALDVFSREPLRESPLYVIKDKYRLLASPHNAWSAEASLKRLIDCIAQNIKTYQAK